MRKLVAFVLTALCVASLLPACAPAGQETVYCLTGFQELNASGKQTRSVQIRYDRKGRIVKYHEEDFNSTYNYSLSYDKADICTVKNPERGVVETYSPEGLLLSRITYANSSILSGKILYSDHYTYHENGDKATLTRDNGGHVSTYRWVYAAPGKPSRMELEDAEGLFVTETYEYDAQGNLLCERNCYRDGAFQETTYTYDEKGNKLTERHTSFSTGITTHTGSNYAYDDRGNLTEEHHFTEDKPPHSSHYYTYDENGNRLTQTYVGTTDSGKTEWTYDDNGNVLTYYHCLNDSWEKAVYTYDSAGKILTVISTRHTFPVGSEAKEEYTYDQHGNMVSRKIIGINGTVTEWICTYKAFSPAADLLATVQRQQEEILKFFAIGNPWD